MYEYIDNNSVKCSCVCMCSRKLPKPGITTLACPLISYGRYATLYHGINAIIYIAHTSKRMPILMSLWNLSNTQRIL